MSDLRKQLDAARDEYRSARYPGDLASELLKAADAPKDRSSMRLFIGAIPMALILFGDSGAEPPAGQLVLGVALLPVPALATCGDYVVRGHAGREPASSQGPVKQQPCHGTTCSQSHHEVPLPPVVQAPVSAGLANSITA